MTAEKGEFVRARKIQLKRVVVQTYVVLNYAFAYNVEMLHFSPCFKNSFAIGTSKGVYMKLIKGLIYENKHL